MGSSLRLLLGMRCVGERLEEQICSIVLSNTISLLGIKICKDSKSSSSSSFVEEDCW